MNCGFDFFLFSFLLFLFFGQGCGCVGWEYVYNINVFFPFFFFGYGEGRGGKRLTGLSKARFSLEGSGILFYCQYCPFPLLSQSLSPPPLFSRRITIAAKGHTLCFKSISAPRARPETSCLITCQCPKKKKRQNLVHCLNPPYLIHILPCGPSELEELRFWRTAASIHFVKFESLYRGYSLCLQWPRWIFFFGFSFCL